jgi:hypothetical protein
MKKRKMVQANLIKNSIAAYFGAVEIHNKPNIPYRYETTTLLLMNAWELILKAYVKKYVKKQSIYTKDNHTISIDRAMDFVEENINTVEPKAFSAVKQNLLLMERYRNNIVHYYNEQLEPYIFMLTAKAALNYVDFLKKYFSKDILAGDGLFILPLGFKLPFKPEDFLTKRSAQYVSSQESRDFIESIVRVINDLNEEGIADTIVVGFDIYLENVKRLKNSDLLVAITSAKDADAKFAKVNKIQITDEPNAQKVAISDEDIIANYPLQYKEICRQCKENIPNFKQNKHFNAIMKEIKKNPKFAFVRRLNPSNKESSQVTFYATDTVDEIARIYKREMQTNNMRK